MFGLGSKQNLSAKKDKKNWLKPLIALQVAIINYVLMQIISWEKNGEETWAEGSCIMYKKEL